MELWSLWTSSLITSLNTIATHIGISEAAAIICLTLLARAVLMPISFTAAYRAEQTKLKQQALKPLLDQLKKQFKDNPAELMSRTMQLYREYGIRFFDRLMLANIGSQTVFGIGLFQALGKAAFSSKFLWISSIAKPDIFVTIAVGILMYFGISLMPNSGAEISAMMIVIPVLIAVITVALMPSSVGIYWATSNAVTLMQTLALRWAMAKATCAHEKQKT